MLLVLVDHLRCEIHAILRISVPGRTGARTTPRAAAGAVWHRQVFLVLLLLHVEHVHAHNVRGHLADLRPARHFRYHSCRWWLNRLRCLVHHRLAVAGRANGKDQTCLAVFTAWSGAVALVVLMGHA